MSEANDEKRVIGVGCAADAVNELYKRRAHEVYQLLEWGSPTLAYAVASGYGLAPVKMPIRGTFPDDLTVTLDQSTTKDKLVMDLVVDKISWHLDLLETPTTVFDAQFNTFFERNSGIEATMDVVGAPRYPIANRFTPVTEIEGPTPGWILSLTNGVTVTFRASFPLPDAPYAATFVLHCRTSRWEKILRMDDDKAFTLLRDLGYDVGPFLGRFNCT